MRTVRNTTQLPVRVPLPGGKTLHLGPAKTGQISDQAAEGPLAAVRRFQPRKSLGGRPSYSFRFDSGPSSGCSSRSRST